MATGTLKHVNASGLNVYFRIFNEAGQVFDFTDSTFKALSGATTPYVAATERADVDGTGRSGYTAAVNLSTINPYPLAVRYWALAFNNGTPAAGDAAISDPVEFAIQCGQIGEKEVVCMLDGAFTSSAGTTLNLLAWLEVGGQRISLAAGSVTVTVREITSGSDLFSVTSSSPTTSGDFSLSQVDPGFTDDHVYRATVAITVNGTTFTTVHGLPVQSAA